MPFDPRTHIRDARTYRVSILRNALAAAVLSRSGDQGLVDRVVRGGADNYVIRMFPVFEEEHIHHASCERVCA